MKYSGLKNPVFLEKLNSANGPSQIQTVKQTLLSFDKENLNQTWIQLFEKVKKHRQTCLLQNNFLYGEFDPGSERTLAAGLTHASWAGLIGSLLLIMRAAHWWVTRGNIPIGGGQQLETIANTA